MLTWYKPGLSRNTDEGAVDKDKASSFQNENADVQVSPGQQHDDVLLASSLQHLNSGTAQPRGHLQQSSGGLGTSPVIVLCAAYLWIPLFPPWKSP